MHYYEFFGGKNSYKLVLREHYYNLFKHLYKDQLMHETCGCSPGF